MGEENKKIRKVSGKRRDLCSKVQTKEKRTNALEGKLKYESASKSTVENKVKNGRTIPIKNPEGKPVKEEGSGHQTSLIRDTVHQKIEKNSDDNSGIDAINRGSQLAEHTAQNSSNALSRMHQKNAIKKEYVSKRSGKAAASAPKGSASEGTKKAAEKAKKAAEKAKDFVSRNSHMLLLLGSVLLIVMLVTGMVGTCSMFFQGSTQMAFDTSFTADNEDIVGAEEDYRRMEDELQRRLENIQAEYPGKDEYNVIEDPISHDPYELAAYLTVLFENYTREQVEGALQHVFRAQYELLIEENVEERIRTETQTGTCPAAITETDPETGETVTQQSEETYETEVEVPYDYFILNVRLINNGFDILLSGFTEDQMERYLILIETKGNRPGIFDEETSG